LYGLREEKREIDLRFWWELFKDPALNRLIESAKRENLPLRIAGLRILESRALLGIADSGRYPQLQQATGAASYVHTHRQGGSLGDDTQDLVSYQAGFNLAWELDFWGRFRRAIESADAAFFASIANQQDVQVLLSAQVADLYYAYRTTQLRIAIARENAAIQKRSYEITGRIFTSGAGSELDLQQAKTQYLATLSTIPDLEITLTTIRNALCAVLGRPPGELPELAGPVGKLPMIASAGVPDIPARLLLRRPDVRRAAWQVAAQSAQIGVAEADYYPAISLLGSIAWSGSTLSGSPDTGTLAIGPALRWNIFDHGRIANNVRVQDARLQQSIESYQDRVLQAAREIDDAAIRVAKTKEQQGVLAESLRAAQRSLELANKRYQEGYAGFQRVLDAQRAVFAQAERQIVNQGSHVSAVVGLYRALGGGWMATPVAQLIPKDVRRTMQERSDWGNLLTAPLPGNPENPPSTSRASQHE
jgi:NodT family efflux transporter outer membrane factor (OMF) lipoprotein